MTRSHPRQDGFTLLEVTFATGVLFLTFVLMLGALAQLAQLRDAGDKRQLAAVCLGHCLEQWQEQPHALLSELHFSPPPGLPGTYQIEARPTETAGLARLFVTTTTSRGAVIQVSALHAIEGPLNAP